VVHNLGVPTKTAPPTARSTTAEPPASEAWRLLFGLFFARKDMFVSIAESAGLRPGDVRALLMLDEPRPMRDVARQMTCDPSTVTGMVDRLENTGYVERRPDAGDRRIKMVALTDDGRVARKQIMAKLQATPDELLRLSVDEQRTLRDLVRKALAPPP
jgi:DNA-binding MarR family transcriptional regulator